MTDRAIDGVDDTLAIEMYRRMVRIRAFDTLVPLLVKMGRIQGTAHPAVGQEAVAVGACARCGPTDRITSTHRGHGHAIAKGVAVGADDGRAVRTRERLLPGTRRRRCTSRTSRSGCSARTASSAVASASPTGAALGCVCAAATTWSPASSGTARSTRARFLENANYAAIHRLPVVYVCEDNGYAMSMQLGPFDRARTNCRPGGGVRIPGRQRRRDGRPRDVRGGLAGRRTRPGG